MLAVLIVAGTFILLRKIERWLHQHIFKVGWLLTHDYRTTTILYYAFFFPGVLLHELTYWLMAGALNVSAERAIQWPEAQEVGELKLNFVRISPKAGIYRRAIITATPLLVALAIIWWGAHNVFDLGGAVRIMSTGDLQDVAAGLRHLTSAPDFWLWVYLLFTISNTMYPAVPKDLQGWRTIAGAVGIIAALAVVIGVGQDVFHLVGEPIGEFLIVLEGVLIFIISINVFMTMVLGAIESAIERITGHSATFKRGKMITMTREEAVALRRKDRERQRKQQALATTTTRRATAEVSISSVYALMLPVPGGPDEEVMAAPVYAIEQEPKLALPDRPAISPRLGAAVVTLGGAPSTSPSLPAGQTKTLPAASGDAKSTSGQKAVSEDQVDEAMRVMRINTPASRNAPPPDVPVTPSQVDNAVETFRASAPPAAPDKPAEGAKPPARPESSPASGTRPQTPSPSSPDKPSTPFNRPAAPFGPPKPPPSISQDDDEDDDEDSALLRPFDAPAAAKPSTPIGTRPASPFGAPKQPPEPMDDDEDDDDIGSFRTPDRPAAAKPSTPFNRPATPFGAPKPTPAPLDDDEDDDEDSALFRPFDLPAAAKPNTPVSTRPASPFGVPKPTPAPLDDDNEDDDDLDSFRTPDRPVAAKPSAPPNTPFNRPAAPFGSPKSTPAPLDDDEDDDDIGSFRTPDRPAAAKPNTPFNRPAASLGSPKPTPAPLDDDDDDEDSALFRPFDLPAAAKPGTPVGTRPASPFGSPKSTPAPLDDDDDLGSFRTPDHPTAAKPTKPKDPEKGVPFERPASPFGAPKSTPPQADDLGAFRQPDRPAAANPGTSRPDASKPKDPEKGVPFERPASPFGAPKSTPPQADDLGAFRQPERPAAANPGPSRPDASKPKDPEKGVPFERPASPFSFPKPADDDDEDEDLSAFRRTDRTVVTRANTPIKPASPFGTPKPPSSDDDDDLGLLQQPDRPAAAKPNTPFKPSSPFRSPSDEKADPNAPRQPNRPAFGTPSPTSVKPMSPFGSQPNADKPTVPPAASGLRPGAPTPPPRFGAKPPTPAPKPSTPFGRKPGDDDESILNRSGLSARDATDDLFEDLRRPDEPTLPPKRTTTTRPIIGSGAFGASRPVPKKPTRPEDEDDDLDDLRDTIRYEDEDLRYSDDDDVSLPGDDD